MQQVSHTFSHELNVPYVNSQDNAQTLANYFSASFTEALQLQPGQLLVTKVSAVPVVTTCHRNGMQKVCTAPTPAEISVMAKHTRILFTVTADASQMPNIQNQLTTTYRAKLLA